MGPDRNHVACLALALTIVTAGWHAAIAADLAVPPRGTPKATEEFSMQAGPPNCSRWTDGCVNCTRGASPTCSNIGFACQPKAIRCIGAP